MKAHTKNRAGTVKLRSANPLDVPEINFHYFYEGTDRDTGEDLEAIVEGFRFARTINEIAKKRGVVKREIWPGPEENVEDEDAIGDCAKDAWGHHASRAGRMRAQTNSTGVFSKAFAAGE